MVEYIRGIKAGVVSGLITGIVFSIISAVMIYHLSLAMQSSIESSSGFSGMGMKDNILEDALVQNILLNAVAGVMFESIFIGIVLGLAISILIARLKVKPIAVIMLSSIVLYMVPKLVSSVSIMGLVGSNIFILLPFVFLFFRALVEGLFLNYFWKKFHTNNDEVKKETPLQAVESFQGQQDRTFLFSA